MERSEKHKKLNLREGLGKRPHGPQNGDWVLDLRCSDPIVLLARCKMCGESMRWSMPFPWYKSYSCWACSECREVHLATGKWPARRDA